jgi:hypothetical protein
VARSIYVPEDFGNEVVAPSGYYVPLEEAFIEYNGRRLLFILGNYCIEASCCGVGSWSYLRVEGYVIGKYDSKRQTDEAYFEIETIENDIEKTEISKLLLDKHPGVRIEFR